MDLDHWELDGVGIFLIGAFLRAKNHPTCLFGSCTRNTTGFTNLQKPTGVGNILLASASALLLLDSLLGERYCINKIICFN